MIRVLLAVLTDSAPQDVIATALADTYADEEIRIFNKSGPRRAAVNLIATVRCTQPRRRLNILSSSTHSGKRYAGSAEVFIDRLASKSSWSGEPYQMICDGETTTSQGLVNGPPSPQIRSS